eukprot:5199592-Pyramimonas_sp.AAC.1
MRGQGEVLREVNFTLPPGSAAILRQVAGYESFDERKVPCATSSRVWATTMRPESSPWSSP